MKNMKKCTNCGSESYRVESKFCLKCGNELPDFEETPHINICTNADCEYNKTKFIYPDDARFCDVCGSKTAFAG
jgi:rRNA maturation endonuclease Nob1